MKYEVKSCSLSSTATTAASFAFATCSIATQNVCEHLNMTEPITPTHATSIPSLQGDVDVECRIYHPAPSNPSQSQDPSRISSAIVAHPYAPLGGCFDDPIVLSLVDELTQLGYIVGTFNFRSVKEMESNLKSRDQI